MDWLRNHAFLNKQQRIILNSNEECDPQACYDSFKEHWQQALKVIVRTQQLPSHDDVLGIVNHLEQMVTLLLYDLKKIDHILIQTQSAAQIPSKCLDYLLTERILENLREWSKKAGKYTNAIRCEELKLYEVLIDQSRHLLLVHEPFLKPLLNLLCSCQGEILSKEIEKILVDLLNHLCAILMQNPDLIDLFFLKEHDHAKFIIFSVLIPYVHREDSVGMRARDALLLCITLSKKNGKVAIFIEESNFSVLVATGLNGLYSVLPNVLNDISFPDWHRLTPDDVNDIKGLSTFVTSLEFSNAVAQVAHVAIQNQLQEFLYRGFLIPVLGPALLQASIEEQIAATAYLELILRTVTNPGLLYALLRFLINMEYDSNKLLNILIQRISHDKHLCLVSLALFETMVSLSCEDLMLELVFQYLQPCLHLMVSQRRLLLPFDPHCHSFEKFLSLSPSCCDSTVNTIDDEPVHYNYYGAQKSLYGKYHAYLKDAMVKINACQFACKSWNNSYLGQDDVSDLIFKSEEKSTSNFSLDASSGYDSLKIGLEEDTQLLACDDAPPLWLQTSVVESPRTESSSPRERPHLTTESTPGPFLTVLLEKLKHFLSNNLYINLHLTGLISRLAVYSQPLLRTYLLDGDLVLQPNVPSLFQIIGSLKQRIDEYMSKQQDCDQLIKNAQDFLIKRETRLVNSRRHITEQSVSQTNDYDYFQRNGPKRRSLNLPSISGMFGRRSSQIDGNNIAMNVQSEEMQFQVIYPKFTEAQHVALCAVLLDEWVKELAALAQEHTFAQLAIYFK